jgi:glycosyltransferase involved in cell wall biosynthesis
MDFNRCLFSSSDTTGCGFIRSFLPARYLDAHFIGGFSRTNPIDQIDHFFFQRQSHRDFFEIVPNLKRYGKKVWYDIDDDLWTIPDSNPAKKAFSEEVLGNIEKIMSLCDGIFCSTEHLKNKLTDFNKCVNVVPNLIEIPLHPKEEKKKIRIGYAGSTSHVGDFPSSLVYALTKLWKKYEREIEFVFVGYIPPEMKDFSYYIQGVDAPHYLNLLNHLNLDIFIIPLENEEFNKSKSNLKWLDASIVGACPVVSNVCCYDAVIDNVTGVVINGNQWFDKLEFLINNMEITKEIAQGAYEFVLENYTWKNAAHKQKEVYLATL